MTEEWALVGLADNNVAYDHLVLKVFVAERLGNQHLTGLDCSDNTSGRGKIQTKQREFEIIIYFLYVFLSNDNIWEIVREYRGRKDCYTFLDTFSDQNQLFSII